MQLQVVVGWESPGAPRTCNPASSIQEALQRPPLDVTLTGLRRPVELVKHGVPGRQGHGPPREGLTTCGLIPNSLADLEAFMKVARMGLTAFAMSVLL